MPVDPLIFQGQDGIYVADRLLKKTRLTRVLAARNRETDARVVIKISTRRTAFEHAGSAFSGSFQEFFGAGAPSCLVEQEARALTRLNDSRIVSLVDRGEFDGHRFVVVEYVDGTCLAFSRVASPTSERVIQIAVELLSALAYMHERGVVHRDISPSNVMISTQTGLPVLIDFELATVDGNGVPGPVGSRDFTSPEGVAAASCSMITTDHRADLYSVGMLSYALLAGAVPVSEDAFEKATVPAPCLGDLRSDMCTTLVRVIERLLAKTPGARYASAGDALADLGLSADAGSPTAMTLGVAASEAVSAVVNLVGDNADLAQTATLEATRSAPPRNGKEAQWSQAIVEISSARRSLWDDAGDRSAAIRLAHGTRRLGRFQESLETAIHACSLDHDDPRALMALADVANRLCAFTEALPLAIKATVLLAGDATALALTALAQFGLGRNEDAFVSVDALVGATTTPDEDLFAMLARACLDAGSPGHALDVSLSACEAAPAVQGDRLLREIAGRLVLSWDEATADPDLLFPLSVACTQLGLRAQVQGGAPETHFARAIQVGRMALHEAAGDCTADCALQLAVAEQSVGDPSIARELLQYVATRWLFDPAAWLARRLPALPFAENRLPDAEVSAVLALISTRQCGLAGQMIQVTANGNTHRGDVARLMILHGRPTDAIAHAQAAGDGLLAALACFHAGRLDDCSSTLNDSATRNAWDAWCDRLTEAGAPQEAARLAAIHAR